MVIIFWTCWHEIWRSHICTAPGGAKKGIIGLTLINQTFPHSFKVVPYMKFQGDYIQSAKHSILYLTLHYALGWLLAKSFSTLNILMSNVWHAESFN